MCLLLSIHYFLRHSKRLHTCLQCFFFLLFVSKETFERLDWEVIPDLLRVAHVFRAIQMIYFLLSWFVLLAEGLGMSCNSKYEVINVCNDSYGNSLHVFNNVYSMFICTTLCSYDEKCASVLFHEKHKSCTTNSGVLGVVEEGCSLMYAEFVQVSNYKLYIKWVRLIAKAFVLKWPLLVSTKNKINNHTVWTSMHTKKNKFWTNTDSVGTYLTYST